ncbi:MAG TPA: hypothetical protein VGJ03_09220 [Acidimicrobiales bacterium]
MPDLSFFGSRERNLRARARGRVLDLGHRDRDGTRVDLEELVRAAATFDSIVSIFQLSSSRHPLREARYIEQLIADDGEFLFLEATATPGLIGSLQRTVGPPSYDIPALLREAGMCMSDCDRITVANPLRPRMYVEGAAFRALQPTRTDTEMSET